MSVEVRTMTKSLICSICGEEIPPGDRELLERKDVKGICRDCFERMSGHKIRVQPGNGGIEVVTIPVSRLKTALLSRLAKKIKGR